MDILEKIPEKLQACCDRSRLLFITGHYGSGKTEFAVNLALALRASGRNLTLVDIDIVNPYFRSREKEDIFAKEGIRLITSSNAARYADVPALPGEISATFDDPEMFSIFDVGGDPAGAHVLARYNHRIRTIPYDFLVVVNANRPQTGTPEKAAVYISAIEESCGLKATGIIDNTHLCGLTEPGDIEAGIAFSEEVSALSGLEVVCHTAETRFLNQIPDKDIFPIEIYMKKPWEI